MSLSVAAGECVCLSGPSGAGKTLLLRAIADLDEHQGRVLLDDVDSMGIPAPEWRKRVGLLSAESHWWADRVGDHFQHVDEDLLRGLGFAPEVMGWSVGRCSTGERQRLALLRLLQNGPEVLLLDEPTASLDADNVQRAEAAIADYRTRHAAAVLWVSHDPGQVKRVCRRAFQLHDGQVTETHVTGGGA